MGDSIKIIYFDKLRGYNSNDKLVGKNNENYAFSA